MGYGRHREIKEQEKAITKEAEIEVPIVLEGDIVIHEDAFEDAESIGVNNVTEVIDVVVDQLKEKIQRDPDKKDVIKKSLPIKKVAVKKTIPKKKRIDNKAANKIGIIGNTVVCNDFRAILAKKGLQINTVLTQILHDWNMANYNI